MGTFSPTQKLMRIVGSGVAVVGFANIYRAAIKVLTDAPPDALQIGLAYLFGITMGLVVFIVLKSARNT